MDDRRPRVEWVIVIGVLATLAATAVAALLTHCHGGGFRLVRRAGGDCPELDAFDPTLAALPAAELERRYRATHVLPPFSLDQQLTAIRTTVHAYRPEKRDCMYRAMLISSIAGAGAAKSISPGLWGVDRASDDLALTFLRIPLRQAWSTGERNDVLAQVDENVLPSLRAESPGDREHWRRMYYGLVITCEATDDALVRLGTTRPADCVHFTPRHPPPQH